MDSKTYILVFDPSEEQWCVYESFGTEEMTHDEMVDRANELANKWFAESLSERISATDETGD